MRYPEEKIKKALDLYDEIQNIPKTCFTLGYPNPNQLRTWIERRKNGEPLLRKSVPLRTHHLTEEEQSPEFKLQIIRRCFVDKERVQSVAKEIGFHYATIYNWFHRYQERGIDGLRNKTSSRKYNMQELLMAIEKIAPAESTPDKAIADDVSTSAILIDARELKAMQDRLKKLELETMVLKETIKVIKKDRGVDNESPLTNREKSEIVDACLKYFPRELVLESLHLSRSSYYYSKQCMKRTDKYAEVTETIKDIFQKNYACYGYRRIKAALDASGITLSEKIVRRIMREEKLIIRKPRRKGYSSYLGEISPAVPNLLNRDFTASRPNQKWVTDISEFSIPAGKVYLSVIVDCHDGLVVAGKVSSRPDAKLANETLDAAISNNPDSHGVILHSDRGGHYRWPGWIERTRHSSLIRSMSRKSNSPDNAACEGFFGRMKNECFYGRSFAGYSLQSFKEYLENYLVWYNNSRIKVSLGNCSPVEYRIRKGLMKTAGVSNF